MERLKKPRRESSPISVERKQFPQHPHFLSFHISLFWRKGNLPRNTLKAHFFSVRDRKLFTDMHIYIFLFSHTLL
jgi:hypothetical protein